MSIRAKVAGLRGLWMDVFGVGRAGAVPAASNDPDSAKSLRENGTWSSAGSSVTPALTVTSETSYGVTPAVGSSALYARQDHTHGSPTAPTAASVGALATSVASAYGLTLIDDANAATARATLGLGGASVLAVGTTAGTVAAGDDSRITGAAQKASNLSDLANAGTARTNLGLGSIATQAASAVTITGGTVTGIADLTVADGGTGASTAKAARNNLGTIARMTIQRNWSWWIDATSFSGEGTGNPSSGGTLQGNDAVGYFVDLQSTATTLGGQVTGAAIWTQARYTPLVRWRIVEGADVTQRRRYFSLASTTGQTLTDTLSAAGVAIRHSTNAGETTWQLVTNDGASQTVVNTTIAVTAAHEYILDLYTNDAGVTWFAYVRDVTAGTEATVSTALTVPTTTTGLRTMMWGNSTGAVTRHTYVYAVDGYATPFAA